MPTPRLALPLVFLLACTPQDDDSDTGDTSPVFEDDPPTQLGAARPATLVRPEGYTPDQEWPLVVLLHGYGANSTLQDVVFGLGQRVERDQFLLLKPEGTLDTMGNRFWNATPECCNFYGSDVDDSAYLTALVEEAQALYPISQVSFVGHSNGGYMTYRMACDHPDLVDRAVVLAGATYKNEELCLGTEAVSVAHVHGTLDPTIVYTSTAVHAGAEESVERWAAKAGCGMTPDRLTDRDYLSSILGDESLIDRYEGCAEGIDIELWTGVGGDHFYLGATDRFRDDVLSFALGTPAN